MKKLKLKIRKDNSVLIFQQRKDDGAWLDIGRFDSLERTVAEIARQNSSDQYDQRLLIMELTHDGEEK